MPRPTTRTDGDVTIVFHGGPRCGEKQNLSELGVPSDRVIEVPGLYGQRYVYRVNLLTHIARYLIVLEKEDFNPYRSCEDER